MEITLKQTYCNTFKAWRVFIAMSLTEFKKGVVPKQLPGSSKIGGKNLCLIGRNFTFSDT